MNCDRYEPMIFDMAAGELDLEGRRALRAHLAKCPECRARLDEVDELLERSKTALDQPAPEMRPLPAALPVRRTSGALRICAAAAGLLIVAAAAGWLGYWRGRAVVTLGTPSVAKPSVETDDSRHVERARGFWDVGGPQWRRFEVSTAARPSGGGSANEFWKRASVTARIEELRRLHDQRGSATGNGGA